MQALECSTHWMWLVGKDTLWRLKRALRCRADQFVYTTVSQEASLPLPVLVIYFEEFRVREYFPYRTSPRSARVANFLSTTQFLPPPFGFGVGDAGRFSTEVNAVAPDDVCRNLWAERGGFGWKWKRWLLGYGL
eukprot:2830574-Amphidinium_carterae.1